MQRVRYRSSEPWFSQLTEEKQPRKNHARWIYRLLLVLIPLILLGFWASQYLSIRGQGYVLVDHLDVQFADAVQVVEISKNEGDSINKGEQMFEYKLASTANDSLINRQWTEVSTTQPDHSSANSYWLEQQLQIDQLTLKIEKDAERISWLQKERDLQQKAKRLGATQNGPNTDFANEIAALQLNLDLIYRSRQQLIAIQKQNTQLLRTPRTTAKLTNKQSNVNPNPILDYYAPVSSILLRMHAQIHETIPAGQILARLALKQPPYILAYFAPEQVEHLKLHRIVDVRLPNGEVEKGHIVRIMPTTFKLPEEFQTANESTKRQIVVRIEPETQRDSNDWTELFKGQVSVTLPRFETLSW